MTKLTYTAANGLNLLSHQIRHVRECMTETGKGKLALKHFLDRRKKIVRRFKLAPFLVPSPN